MIKQEIRDKTVQWITLEKEVTTEVFKKIDDGEMSHEEWADFFINAVREYGNEGMIKQLKIFVDYLKSIKSSTGEINENIDEMFENLRDE